MLSILSSMPLIRPTSSGKKVSRGSIAQPREVSVWISGGRGGDIGRQKIQTIVPI